MIAAIKPSAMRPELLQKLREMKDLISVAYPEVQHFQVTINNVARNVLLDSDVTLQVQI